MPDSSSPLNMGAPWDMLSAGKLTSDYGQQLQGALAAPQPGPVAPPPGQEELANALNGMREFQAKLSVQQKAATVPSEPLVQTVKTDPKTGKKTWSGTMDADAAETIMQNSQKWQTALGGYAQQMDQIQQKLQAQEQALRNQPPWVQLATALSANLAQAKVMPGWVQAAGRTAAQLNPNPDEIAMRRMGVLGQQAQLAEKGAGLEGTMLRAQLADAEKRALIATKVQDDMTRIEKDASVGARTRGEFDSEEYIKEMVSKGQDPKQATTAAARLEGIAKATRSRLEADVARKDAAEQEKENRFYAKIDATAAEHDKMLAAQAARAETATKTSEDKTTKAEAAKAAKLAEPGPVLKKQLADLNAADNALDEIEKLMNDPKNQALMGPISGRLRSGGAAAGLDPGGAVAGLRQKLMLQTAQAIKATGAGARGFGPQERPYFEQLSEGINRLPEQNLKIVQGWREFLDQERRGIQVSNPDVAANAKYAAVWGKRLSPSQQEATTSAPPAGARDAGGPRQKVTKLVYNPATGQVEEK